MGRKGAREKARSGPGPGWEYSESKRVAGDHATSLHQGLGDASEVTEELLLLGVRLQGSHALPDPGCSLGRGRWGSSLFLELSTPVLGNPRSHLNTPAVTEHFLMLGCGVALTERSGGPGGKQEKTIQVVTLAHDPAVAQASHTASR